MYHVSSTCKIIRVVSMPAWNLQEQIHILFHGKFDHIKHTSNLETGPLNCFRSNQLEGLRTSYLMAIDGPAFSWLSGWPSSTLASRALETITQ